ncbi:hypothetical protein [Thermococcus sp.]|uniref:hypothetical protein n=1 Tax=Thermococcus sp. TaxID=35749 RepID=UPI0034580723
MELWEERFTVEKVKALYKPERPSGKEVHNPPADSRLNDQADFQKAENLRFVPHRPEFYGHIRENLIEKYTPSPANLPGAENSSSKSFWSSPSTFR